MHIFLPCNIYFLSEVQETLFLISKNSKLGQIAQGLLLSSLSILRDGVPIVLSVYMQAMLWPAQPVCGWPSSPQGCSAASWSRELTVPRMQKLGGDTS